jgi:hypothetical protein
LSVENTVSDGVSVLVTVVEVCGAVIYVLAREIAEERRQVAERPAVPDAGSLP